MQDVQGCRIELAFDKCNATAFTCDMRTEDDMGNSADCARDFKDSMMWSMFASEPVFQAEEFNSLRNYWNNFHEFNNCAWDCEYIDCAVAYDLTYCEEKTCFNSCDMDYYCEIEGTYDGEDFEYSCEQFMNYTQGNATHDECMDHDLYLMCSDFDYFEGQQCQVNLAYNSCDDTAFFCEISGQDEDGMYFDDCSASFYDPMFWMVFREENWWMEHPEHLVFAEYWDWFHSENHGDYSDYDDYNTGSDDYNDDDDYDMDNSEYDWDHSEDDWSHSENDWDNSENDWDHSENDWDNSEYDWDHSEDDWNNDYEDDYMGPECQWKEIYTSCADFEFIDDECAVYVRYNPCIDDMFICQSTKTAMTDYDLVEQEDCTEDFLNVNWWNAMREEEFWFRPENAEYVDFFNFWDQYHFERSEECAWKDMYVSCADFEFS